MAKKIAVLSVYSGIVDRGVETFVYELTKRLNGKFEIIIFQGGEKIANPRIKTHVINAYIKKPNSSTGFLAKFYLDLPSLKIFYFTLKSLPQLKKNRFDVIIPTNGGWQTLVIKVFSIFSGSKVLISGHAGVGANDTWNILLRPDVFVALTSAQQNWAKKLSPEQRIVKITNGVDLAVFNPKVRAKDIDLPRPIVVCASALVPYKRIDQTIRAAAKANLSLLLLGDGQQKGYLDNLGKKLLAKKYLRINPSYKDMPMYYRAGDVFTLVSKTEAFGISYLEAMACNLPVVATQDESREEIVGRAGILTNPLNVDTYAADLKIAASTKYRSIPYDQALKFSWNMVSKKYANVIKNL